ncbi:MAG: YjjG family noncanonical pyrimidine nucleotidase [Bacteroidetes bacterium]|nr:YjjG family noncanonical pyrimidine nucleotidase [Bacteroidota bacterium]MBU1116138.1 YjjG family noncanonical pyrimidine nucleotidase [Bacteroidota bacterium]MBU1800430.1 YjjG family noncanonical pyrimidine nucleotidase [Bacteroidota bacterium]
MKYKIVLFDADGTLYDFDKAAFQALKSSFNKYKLNWTDDIFEVYEIENKKIWDDFEKGLITTDGIKTERFKRFFDVIGVIGIESIQFSKDYLEFLSQNSFLLAHAEEIVKWSSEKFELAIVTNGLASVQNPRFMNSRLRKYFKHIIISEEIGFAKPKKGIFDYTFNKFNNPSKESVIIIGDNLTSDIKGGLDYGIDACWFNPTKIENNNGIVPTFEISKLNELKKILM